VTLTYVACFVALAVLRHWIVGGPLLAEIAPITARCTSCSSSS